MIHISHLTKTFRRQRVLDDLSLKIEAKDRVALIGSNGAGKTTLIRCLLGEYVFEGTISVYGKSPRAHRADVLKQIGFVPQLPPPLKMPVGELMHFAAKVCGVPQENMRALVERMGLDLAEISRKPFEKLSGGQKQKILLSIAMGRESELLILDEPTANLDPAARQIFFDLLAERIDQPVLISSHRLEEVSGLVNRVIELDRGKVVLDDRVADQIDTAQRQECRIALVRPHAAFAKAIGEWDFVSDSEGLEWRGTVAGPDRLRFLGVLSRYAGLLESLTLSPSIAVGSAQDRTLKEMVGGEVSL